MSDDVAEAPVETDNSPANLVGLFAAELEAENAPAAPAKQAPESEPPAEAVEAEEAAPEEGTDAAEGHEPDAQPAPAITAPNGMSEEDRQRFAQLTPEVQAWVTQREQQRTADYTRKTQEAATLAKAAAAERQQLGSQLEQYSAFLSQITTRKIEPPNPDMQFTDPDGYQQQLGQYVSAKHQQEQAQQEQLKVNAQRTDMEAKAYREFIQTEHAKLNEMMPEFTDPKTGPSLKKAVMAYAEAEGFGEVLPKATAKEVSILVKAMRYDAAQKAAKTSPVVANSAPRSSKPGPAKAPGQRNTTNLATAVSNLMAGGSRASLAAAYAAELASER